jgi:hypothetical protein
MRPHGTLSVIHGVCTVRRYVFSVPLWLFFLDVTKVPNLCPPPSQRKEGEKRNSSDKKERERRERYKVIRHVILARREGVLSIPPMENGDPPD